MKQVIFLFLITVIFRTLGFAQTVKTKVPALPVGIADWKGEDSSKILDNAVIKARLKKLLGKKNYASFLESFETQNPIEKNGDILFSSGCLIHACGHLESAIAIDLANNTIHAAIYNEEKKTRYFNEKGSKTPESIISWANRLSSLKDNKNQSSKGH
ncbi:MAG: hypothetical protein WKF34_10800 [Pyrinomonadaceae bacterium]